jgi:hypothetical protein
MYIIEGCYLWAWNIPIMHHHGMLADSSEYMTLHSDVMDVITSLRMSLETLMMVWVVWTAFQMVRRMVRWNLCRYEMHKLLPRHSEDGTSHYLNQSNSSMQVLFFVVCWIIKWVVVDPQLWSEISLKDWVQKDPLNPNMKWTTYTCWSSPQSWGRKKGICD